MKNFVVFLFLFLPINVFSLTTNEKVTFNRCVDGDTAVFMIEDEEIKFRFLAIDTPETVHPTKEVEAFGKNASEYTCNKLTNAKEIIVEYEEGNKIDKYERYLAWIWVDGSLLQSELVKAGYATVAYIYGDYRYTESLCQDQKEARDNNLGMWQDTSLEEGYCGSIKYDDAKYNIDFTLLDTVEKEEKIADAIQKLDKLNDSINDFEKKYKNFLGSSYTYVFIGIAALVLIIKGFLKK